MGALRFGQRLFAILFQRSARSTEIRGFSVLPMREKWLRSRKFQECVNQIMRAETRVEPLSGVFEAGLFTFAGYARDNGSDSILF